eukprot:5256251-Alexandrium_andersonii.AAC.1
MSASLVGSEMCIRHSCGRWGRWGRWVHSGRLGRSGRSGCSECSVAQRSSCLLYTSDAADDM